MPAQNMLALKQRRRAENIFTSPHFSLDIALRLCDVMYVEGRNNDELGDEMKTVGTVKILLAQGLTEVPAIKIGTFWAAHLATDESRYYNVTHIATGRALVHRIGVTAACRFVSYADKTLSFSDYDECLKVWLSFDYRTRKSILALHREEYRGFEVSGGNGHWYVKGETSWLPIYTSKAEALEAVDRFLALRQLQAKERLEVVRLERGLDKDQAAVNLNR